jgi:putative hydrolase
LNPLVENVFKRFKDVDHDYLYSEMHCHSTWTDGLSSVYDIVEKAESIGLKKLIFTDHVRKKSNYFNEYAFEIRKLSKRKKIEIFVGFESKIADFEGNLDITNECRSYADIIIGTVHSFPSGKDFVHPSELPEKKIEETEYKLILNAIEKGDFDIVGHAGGMSITLNGSFPIEYIEDIIAKCVDYDKAFEINSRYHRDIIDELTELLKKYNPLVSIGSDAHSIDQIGTCSKILREKINHDK